MRIAIVHSYPVHSRAVGGTTRVHALVRHLAARHEVIVLTHRTIDEEESVAAERELAEIGVVQRCYARPPASWLTKARWAIGREPYFVAHNRNPALVAAAAAFDRERKFDVAHLELSLLEPALDGFGPHVARVLAEQELMSLSIERLRAVDFRHKSAYQHYITFELPRIRRFETQALRRFDHRFAITDVEAARMREASGCAVEVLPHVVDTRLFGPGDAPASAMRVLFVGNYRHHPNVEAVFWLMERVWPTVRARLPAATVSLVGPGLDAVRADALRRLGADVPGRVEDLVACYLDAAVFANPVLSGGGMRGKILEAFACAIPVVSTSVGLEGTAGEDGVHWRRADSPDAFAAALVALLRSPDDRAAMGSEARTLVEARYDVRRVLARVEEVFESVVAARRRREIAA